VSAYNRRHHCTGTLWDGRFRCAVIEPGAMRLAALRLIDGQASEAGLTSASLRSGQGGGLVDPPEVWALGNTPFEREAGYRRLLEEGLAPGLADALRRAALGGWAVGSPDFAAHMAQASDRPTLPRARGRPRRALG
jgi:putative transposase